MDTQGVEDPVAVKAYVSVPLAAVPAWFHAMCPVADDEPASPGHVEVTVTPHPSSETITCAEHGGEVNGMVPAGTTTEPADSWQPFGASGVIDSW